ncbi:MAG: hypothetical protein OXL98_01970 [Acidimicrobiaceae bacterium]|nr:hypothetical protein [Acidimicrobiaceae bacterium]
MLDTVQAPVRRDLRALTDAGLLDAAGAGRGRTYHGSPDLRALWADIRSSRPPKAVDDPHETLAQQQLPGIDAPLARRGTLDPA